MTDPPGCGEVRVVAEYGGTQGYRLVEFRCRGCGEVHRRVYFPPYPGAYSDECGDCWHREFRERIQAARRGYG